MKKFLLITSCFLSLSPLSYAMEGVSSLASQEENGRLVIKRVLLVPYETTTFDSKQDSGATEVTHKTVEVSLFFDKDGHMKCDLLFSTGFPGGLKTFILSKFNRFEDFPQQKFLNEFECFEQDLPGGLRIKEKLMGSPQHVVAKLLRVRNKLREELSALKKDPSSVPVAAVFEFKKYLPLAPIQEEEEDGDDDKLMTTPST